MKRIGIRRVNWKIILELNHRFRTIIWHIRKITYEVKTQLIGWQWVREKMARL